MASSSSAASKEEASEKSVDKSETKRVEPSPQQRAVQQEKITPSTVNNSANNTPAAQSTKTNGVSPNSSSGTVATPTVTNKMKRSATTPVDDGPKKKKARVSKVEEDEDEVLPLHLLTTIKFRDCKVVAAKFHPKHDHIVVGTYYFKTRRTFLSTDVINGITLSLHKFYERWSNHVDRFEGRTRVLCRA